MEGQHKGLLFIQVNCFLNLGLSKVAILSTKIQMGLFVCFIFYVAII